MSLALFYFLVCLRSRVILEPVSVSGVKRKIVRDRYNGTFERWICAT